MATEGARRPARGARDRSDRETRGLWLLLAGTAVFVFAAAVYLPTLGHGFVWDDVSILMANESLGDWSKLATNLLPGFFHESSSQELLDYWRPAVVFSHMIDRALFGSAAWGPHLVNALLHAVTSVLVLLLGHAWSRSVPQSFVGGLIFAAHPVHVEVVAWVSGRSDLLLGLFVALALWADIRHGRTGRLRWMFVSLGAFGFALLSKESAIILPVLIAVRVLLTRGAEANGRRGDSEGGGKGVLEVVAFLVLLGGFLWLRFGLFDATIPAGPASSVGRSSLFWTWWSAFALYLKLMLLPLKLTILHQVELARSAGSPNVIAGLLAFFGLLWLGLRTGRRAPTAAFGIAVLLTSLATVSNFVVPVSRQGGAEFPVAERFLYLPSIGFCLLAAQLLIGWLPARLRAIAASGRGRNGSERGRHRPFDLPKTCAAALAGVLILALTIRSEFRIRDWKSDLTLFGQAVEATPGSYLAHLNYAAARVESAATAADERSRATMIDEARRHYLEAARLAPDNYRVHFNLANLYRSTGRAREAEEFFERALALNPDLYQAQINLGVLLAEKNDLEGALERFRAAERLRPDLPAPKVNQAHVLQMLGRPAPAIALYEGALELDPNLIAAREGLRRARVAASSEEPE